MNAGLKFTLWPVLIILLMLLVGCSGRAIETLPDTDIVFQSMWDGSKANSLGFVDADASNLTYLRVRCCRDGMPAFPTWTSDGNYLIFRAMHTVGYTGDLYAIGPDRRLISYPTQVAFGDDGAAITEDGRHFVIHEAADPDEIEHLYLLAIESGEVEKVYVTETKLTAFVEVGTSALHDSLLVYVRTELINDQNPSFLIVRDLNSGQERVLTTSDRIEKPAISPDGRSVAYTAADGIYVVPTAGGDSRRVVATAVRRERCDWSPWDVAPPVASWSPDSRWLVYHRCTLPAWDLCGNLADYSVFKVNVETGEEVLLVEQGLHPYWRAKGRQ